MARQHKVLSGGVIVLCLTLLLAPVTHSQGFTASIKKFVISGSVGLPGVTMQGLPGAPMTDENGVYSAEVAYGWKGTVSPVKLGYTFEPKQKVYQKVTGNQTDESYAAKLLTFTISGSAGMPGVQIKGLPGDPISDQTGRYATTVEYGWSGNVTPEKVGYRFDPPTKMYDQLRKDLAQENYTAHELTYIISGSAGVDGAAMKGLPGNVITSGGGNYRAEVPYGWTGKVTPLKEGHQFVPEFLEYPVLMSDQTNQNYTANVFTYQIVGTTNMAGVVLKGLPDDPISNENGYYTAIVPHGWSGKVTPERVGYIFSPPSKTYAKVVSEYESQDYTPTIIQLTISGSAGTSGVTMDGLPGNVVSDATGRYSVKVEYGWSGTVTPMKDGWSLEPSSKIYASVTGDQLNQNFKGQRITYTISGNVSLPGVVLEGLPGRVVSGADGSFSAVVTYKWTGKITPKRAGYTFDPAMREYSELLMSQMAQDFSPQVVQHAITGRIVGEAGPVADIFVFADNNGGNTTTDADGKFQLSVDHGWRGKVTPDKEGYLFTPANRSFEPVGQNVSNANFVGRVKMLTITDSIVFGTEPIQAVTITAQPGGTVAVTNAKGKYSLQVPYGWTGELFPTKEGFEFNPASIPYTNVIDDIDNTAPATPVYTPPSEIPSLADMATPSAEPGESPSTATQTPGGPETQTGSERQLLLERMQRLQTQMDQMQNGTTPTSPGDQTTLRPDQILPQTELPFGQPMPVESETAFNTNLLDVLTQISQKTGVKIGVDATVKSVPVAVAFDWTGMPVPMVLQRILEPTGYTFRAIEGAYLVYSPVNNTFQGDDLRQALQDIAMAVGVTIVADPNVSGEVYAELQDVPLETALRTILAGSPFVVRVTPDYYLVADRSVEGDAFPEISETHNVRLNYLSSQMATELLSPAFLPYVKASSDPNSHFVSITASPEMVDRIVSDLRGMDIRPRHVLLDARVVVMERTDLLDVGVEWDFPQISAGTFAAKGVSGMPWSIQIGYTPDQTFTNSLLMALNLLQENGEANIVSNPQVVAQDGKMSEMRVMTEEYYMLQPRTTNNAQFFSTTELVTIISGTQLQITPRIGDNNDITLEMAVEVSNSIPAAAETQLPVVTRRTVRNMVTISDGGTVALAGLTENRSETKDRKVPGFSKLPLIGPLFKNKNEQGITKEVAVFVTAHLVPETGRLTYESAPQQPVRRGFAPQQPPMRQGFAPQQQPLRQAPAENTFQQDLMRSLESQPR